MASLPPQTDNPHKRRTGVNRLYHAWRFSLRGLRHAWSEAAFRLETLLALLLVPGAFWIGRTWLEITALICVLVLVLVVELLNTAIEVVIDRIGPEWHDLSGKAKDLGSAAVLLASLAAGLTWGLALWSRFA